MSKFSDAFAAARKAGKKEFKFNGKSYNTKRADDTPQKGPIPSPAPRNPSKAATGNTIPSKSAAPSKASTGLTIPSPEMFRATPKRGPIPAERNPALRGNVRGLPASAKSDRLPAKADPKTTPKTSRPTKTTSSRTPRGDSQRAEFLGSEKKNIGDGMYKRK